MNIDIPHATEQLNATKQFLVEYRTDSNFDRVLSSARQLADELETEAVFPPQSAARQRKRKKMFPYEGDDTPVMDTKQNYRVGFFNQVLDCAIRSVEERFSLLRDHGRVFGFLYDIASLKEKENTIVLQDCLRLEKALTHGDSRDVDGHELFEELTALGRRLVAGSKPLDALKFICEKGMESIFPNVFVALRVLLTLPVTVSSGERSFSKLKLIKNYLRSTMTQDRLNGLATFCN